MEKLFKLQENGTTVKTELLAGLTTFMTMAYIIALNPNLLTNFAVGTPLWNGVFLATCAACLASFCFLTLFALKKSPTVTMVKTTIQPHNDTSGTAIDTITRIRSTIAARIPNIIATIRIISPLPTCKLYKVLTFNTIIREKCVKNKNDAEH
mgnify:CR=1 FL=1